MASKARKTDQEIEELKTRISKLPKDKPKVCEGLIRELSIKISLVSKENVKEELKSELKAVSCLGLSDDLKKLVEENGLNMEALDLVVKYLTTVEELAKYFFTHAKSDDKDDGLDAVRRRLSPKLEVLGGLSAKGIDVTKDWATKLVKEAPSFQSLSRMSVNELEELYDRASHGEKEDVNRLVRNAESRARQTAAAQNVQEIGEKEGNEKGIDQEKLEKAKALMNEAKKMAQQQSEEAKKAVNEKVAEISKILQLPPDWNKQDVGLKPEQPFQQLDGIIKQLKSGVEVGEAYNSDLEVVRKASGGRALCGIYYSEHVPPATAELPIIVMPSEVILTSPNNAQQVEYVKFSKSRAAANYVQAVTSSSSNIGLSVGGFYELFVGEISGSDATRSKEEETTSEKAQTSSASVLQYIWIATKTFKIEQERLKLSTSARKMARAVVKNEDTARLFMQRYGSHFPAGLHTLGGVLFRIVDAESTSEEATSVLTEKAAQQLQGQISVGFIGGLLGIGASISGEQSSSSGKTEGQEKKADNVSYTFSSQSLGPATTNPATFPKLLANNSTWALIDRGSPNAYIPIWELIRDLGSDFEEAAKILENTWRKDEAERKQKIVKQKRGKDIAELASKIYQTGEYVLKITNFTRKLSAAKDRNTGGDIYSDPFYTSPLGYKVRLQVRLNDTREKYKDKMGAFLIIMKSDHDAILSWPFKKKYTLTLIDQEEDEEERENIEKTETPGEEVNFKKPESEENVGYGFALVSHETLETRKYIVDDTVFIKIKIDQYLG